MSPFSVRPWDEVGTTYYVVVAAGSPAPTSDDVKHLRAAPGSTALACGVFSVAEGFLNVTQHVQGVNVTEQPECAVAGFYGLDSTDSFYGLGTPPPYCAKCPKLDSQTAYDIYVVAEDDGGGSHSSTFQLNLSALCEIGGARQGCVARVKGC